MSVAQTTRLTVVLALVSLFRFGLASRWLGRGGQPLQVAAVGAALGVPAFLLVLSSAVIVSAELLIEATLLAGFGAGPFGHGTLMATMRSAPRDQIGLSLGVWGAVQTTAAGIAIAVGGVIRDAMLLAPGANVGGAKPFVPVFALEAGLLVLALLVALPLWRKSVGTGLCGPSFEARSSGGGQETMVAPEA